MDRLGRFAKGPLSYRNRKRRRLSLELIANSELFDRSWYLATYRDVRDSGVDPARHYLESGWREGRDPGPDFCTTAYLKANCDVATLGINPLLHYIEHGRFEGRGAPHQGAPPRASFSPEERFGPAAPCALFSFDRPAPVRWVRAGRIPKGDTAAEIGGLTIAVFESVDQRAAFSRALTQLSWFSGKGSAPPASFAAYGGITLDVQDASQAGRGLLRTRWVPSSQPLVVRAIQHIDDHPVLVGEGCTAGDLSFIDLRPVNPFYPLLFVFTTPEGDWRGFRQWTFPSLIRGSLHYLESVALTAGTTQPTALQCQLLDLAFGQALFQIRTGASRALVSEIVVDTDLADGSSPLFQEDCRSWLANVMCVGARAKAAGGDERQRYLEHAMALDPFESRSNALAGLKLSGDMVPSLSVLTAADAGASAGEAAGSMILVSRDEALGTYIRVPTNVPLSQSVQRPLAVPTLDARPDDGELPLLALRLSPGREVADAELLYPPSRTSTPPSSAAPVTWLFRPEDWNAQDLKQSVQALLEQATGRPEIVFVGTVGAPLVEATQAILKRPPRVAATMRAALNLIGTQLVGFMGPGIVLHNRETTAQLSALLLDDLQLSTVTALIVSAERRGKGSTIRLIDDPVNDSARLLPDSVVPVAKASDHFWLARCEAVRGWFTLQNGVHDDVRHVCSTRLSVSRSTGARQAAPLIVPPSNESCAIAAEVLVG